MCDLELSTIRNHHIHQRLIPIILLHSLDLTHHIHSLHHLAKHDMLSVQMRSSDGGDKELRSVCSRSCVCHTQITGTGVLEREVFIFKAITVDGQTASSVLSSKRRRRRRRRRRREMSGVEKVLMTSLSHSLQLRR